MYIILNLVIILPFEVQELERRVGGSYYFIQNITLSTLEGAQLYLVSTFNYYHVYSE